MAFPTTASLQQLYVAYFNRPADPGGLVYWSAALTSEGASIADVSTAFSASAEYQGRYGDQTADQFVNAIYQQLFGRDAEAGGLEYWSSQLNSGVLTAGQLAAVIAQAASTNDALVRDNKVKAAIAFTEQLDTADEIAGFSTPAARAAAAAFLSSVGASLESLAQAIDPAALSRSVALATGTFSSPSQPGSGAAPVIPPKITSSDEPDVITEKLAAYSGSDAQVDAAGMSGAQLLAVSLEISKIKPDGISALSLALGSQEMTDQVFMKLLSKSALAEVTLDSTAASPNEIGAVLDNLGRIASGGISGSLTLPNDIDASHLEELLAKLAPGATIDVSLLNASSLQALAVHAAGLTSGVLTGALALSAALDAAAIDGLLNSYAGSTATVLATGMDGAALNAVAASLGKVQVGGISGSLALGESMTASNTLALLGKYLGTSASVDVGAFSNDQLASLLPSLGSIASINGTFALSNTLDATSLSALLNKTSVAANVTMNAAGMSIDQVVVLFQQASKLDSLASLYVPAGTMARLPADIGPLFTKGIGLHVDLTGASNQQLKAVAMYVNHYANNGLTGIYILDNTSSAGQLSSLLSVRVSDEASVTINAVGMSEEQLKSVAGSIGKADQIIGLCLMSDNAQNLLVSEVAALLSKSTDASVNATGLGGAQVSAILHSLNNIIDGGISGNLGLDVAAWQQLDAGTLTQKLAPSASVKLIGTAAGDEISLAGMTHKILVHAGAGADSITLGSGSADIYVGGQADTRSVAFSSQNTTAENIDKVVGLKGNDKIVLSASANAFGDGVTFSNDTLVSFIFFNIVEEFVSFEGLYEKLSYFFPNPTVESPASTSNVASVANVSFSSGAQIERYLIINDANAAFDENDTIIRIVGNFPTSFAFGDWG